MEDLSAVVERHVAQLRGPSADEACYCLLALGPLALPYIAKALRTNRLPNVRLRLAQVVAHSRTIEAVSWLADLLDDPVADIWKTALDGLVMVGSDSLACPLVWGVLTAAEKKAGGMKREWIVEALGQIPPPDVRANERETGEPG